MMDDRLDRARHLEGRHVDLALRNGARIEGCQLVSAGRTRAA